MMRASVFSIAIALSISGSIARAQRDARLAGFDSDLREQLLAVVDSAARGGLPVEPILDIARKGRVMGLAPNVIVQAVRGRAGSLQRARDVLGSGATGAEIEAAAGALGAGVAPSTLLDLRRQRPGKDLSTPFGLLESMMLRVSRRTAPRRRCCC